MTEFEEVYDHGAGSVAADSRLSRSDTLILNGLKKPRDQSMSGGKVLHFG